LHDQPTNQLLSSLKFDGTDHVVQFYDDSSSLVSSVIALTSTALYAGKSVLLLPTGDLLEDVRKGLLMRGLDLRQLRKAGRLTEIEADYAVTLLTTSGALDAEKFHQLVPDLLKHASQASSDGSVLVFGEVVSLLYTAAGGPDNALRLEQLWNGLMRQYSCYLYCAYSLDCLGETPSPEPLLRICAQHSLTVAS
jgi:hypothetical protein